MVVAVNNIKKRYKKGKTLIKALDGVSFSIGAGSVVGILGPNGAGKTTLLKIITGITVQDYGGVIISDKKNTDDTRDKLGFLPENPSFFKNITAFELLSFSLSLMNKQYDKTKIEEILSLVNLKRNKNEKVRSFSKGMVQRLGIAQAIIHEPEIYIFDEPMSGLDPLGRKMVKEIILSSKRKGKTVLFSTHNLDDIENLCDEVIMIKKGKIIIDKKISEIRNSNSYNIEILKNGSREILSVKGKSNFWNLMENIKKGNEEIISIRSDISGELEKYYEE